MSDQTFRSDPRWIEARAELIRDDDNEGIYPTLERRFRAIFLMDQVQKEHGHK